MTSKKSRSTTELISLYSNHLTKLLLFCYECVSHLFFAFSEKILILKIFLKHKIAYIHHHCYVILIVFSFFYLFQCYEQPWKCCKGNKSLQCPMKVLTINILKTHFHKGVNPRVLKARRENVSLCLELQYYSIGNCHSYLCTNSYPICYTSGKFSRM